MKLLLKRSQAEDGLNRYAFRLWAKIEFEGDEEEIANRYGFVGALLIDAPQPGLLRMVAIVGAAAAILVFAVLWSFGVKSPILWAVLAGLAAAWIYYDRTRESVYVRDLIHGRNFGCRSVVDVARKEAWIGVVTGFLRQVMESAKNWDGTETIPIEALSKDEAKLVVIRGL